MASLPADAGRCEPIRLLWLIDSLTLGGAESLVGPFARALDPRRFCLQVAFLKRIGGNPFEAPLRAQGIPCLGLEARNLRDLGALRRLVRLVRAGSIDLIHAHLTYASIFGLLAGRITGRPCLVTLHTAPPKPRWSRPYLRERLLCGLIGRWAAGVVTVSESVRQAYAPRLSASKLTVVHNGVEGEAFTVAEGAREATRAALGLAPGTRAVLTVSVLRQGKGIDVLLRAAAEVGTLVPEAVFLVAGDGPSRLSLEAEARRAGLGERVRWLGFRRDVSALLAAADLFVLPSLDDAFPTALLEAMAAGRAAVAARTGGIPEIVDDGRTGRLVPPADARALARAVADLLLHAEERAAMGEAGRLRARGEFSSAAWVERLTAVYQHVLADRGEAA